MLALPFLLWLLLPLAAYSLGSLAARRTDSLEILARAAAAFLNASFNLIAWTFFGPPWGVYAGLWIAAIGLVAFALARYGPCRSILGWSSWLMPMSWPATLAGFLVFTAYWIAHRTLLLRFDPATGTLETSGLPPIRGFRGGFSLGNFTFLVDAAPTPFRSVGISAHEVGHTLNVAAFGSVWHLLGNGVEENLRPWKRGALAYGELLAESHHPDATQDHLRQWC